MICFKKTAVRKVQFLEKKANRSVRQAGEMDHPAFMAAMQQIWTYGCRRLDFHASECTREISNGVDFTPDEVEQ